VSGAFVLAPPRRGTRQREAAPVIVREVPASAMPALAGPWRRLLDSRERPDPSRRAEWLAAWWETFGGGNRTAHVMTAWRGPRLVGVAPLMVQRLPGGIRVLRHLGVATHWSDPDWIVEDGDSEARSALVDAALALPHDLLALEDLDPDGPLAAELGERAPRARLIDLGEQPLRILMDRPGSLGRRRKQMRQRMRRAAEAGRAPSVTVHDTPAAIAARLDEALDLNARVWGREDESGISRGPAQRAYAAELVRTIGRDGSMIMAEVRVDDRLVAFDLAAREGAGAVLFRGAYDRELDVPGAGWMSMLAAVDHLAAQGARSISLGKKPWPYKRLLASEDDARFVTVVAARGARGRVGLAVWTARPTVLAVRARLRRLPSA
jgi:CelD/BcsL family acetyltransferase involved in cellulose biosynthesis